MKELILIIVTAALINNVVLNQFLGICSFLGVSSKMKASASLGVAGRMTLPLLRHPGAWSRSLAAAIYHAYLRRHPEWARTAKA